MAAIEDRRRMQDVERRSRRFSRADRRGLQQYHHTPVNAESIIVQRKSLENAKSSHDSETDQDQH